MAELYNWKRFWCPRSGDIRLDWRGYLSDPESEWGKHENPNLVTLDKLTDVPCLVLLGEPGIGKSQEMTDLVNHAAGSQSHSFIEINLRSCSHLASDLSQEPDFVAWMDGSDRLYLFLDSLDEGLLEARNLAVQVVDEFRKKKYRDKIGRLYLRIACRTAVFPQVLEEGLREIWGNENTDFYELAPLRQADVEVAASKHGIEPQIFLAEIDRKKIGSFAIRPITLKFLINRFKNHNGHFPDEQSLADIYLDGCRALCEDPNPSRRVGITGKLEVEKRLIVAARIAAVTIFANRFAIWTEPDNGDIPVEDVLIGVLAIQSETAGGNSFPVSEDIVREVLDTGLFSSRGVSGRMGWAHQTYAEFLAAWYLKEQNLETGQILDLILHSDGYVIPQLQETASWIASMIPQIFQALIQDNPDVLLQSDLLDDQFRESIVASLLHLYETNQLFNDWESTRDYARLKHPAMFEQLRPYITDDGRCDNARDLAIDIAQKCQIVELQEDLISITLDSTQEINLRVSACRAIREMADNETKLRVMPLIMHGTAEDEYDELKGYCLSALWPGLISTEQMFACLTRPKRLNFVGSYKTFYEFTVSKNLMAHELNVALEWIARQGIRCFGNPFERLADQIIMQAYLNLDNPAISKELARVGLLQWHEYQSLITSDSKMITRFCELLAENSTKRHLLIQATVSEILASQEDPDRIIYSLKKDGICVADDLAWLLEQMVLSQASQMEAVWVNFIVAIFERPNGQHIDLILAKMPDSEILHQIFHWEFQAVDLDSERANVMRSDYQEREDRRSRLRKSTLLSPSPQERILECLNHCESGNLSKWINLTGEMTLRVDSTHYGDEFIWDLTQLPGWKEADSLIRQRITQMAKAYVLDCEGIPYDWIGTNSFDRRPLAGCKALLLLYDQSPDLLCSLPSKVWEQWTPGLIAAPGNNGSERCCDLIGFAYSQAPEAAVSTLIRLIDTCNRNKESSISEIYILEKSWDDRLSASLFELLKGKSLHPPLFEYLMEKLLRHKSDEARQLAESLVILGEKSNEYFLPSLRALGKHLNALTWPVIWNAIQKDRNLACRFLESIASHYPYGNEISLDEQQLGELYIWLVHEYPYDEDPDYSQQSLAHCVTDRESIGRFRDNALAHLKFAGTEQACKQIQQIMEEFPQFDWLPRTLAEARKNLRLKHWRQKTPEEFLQLVLARKPFNLESLPDQLSEIKQEIKKVADEPKTVTNNHITDSQINAPVGNNGPTNNQVTISSPAEPKTISWSGWVAVLLAIIAILTGIFNQEANQWLKQRFNHIPPAKIEPQSQPPSK
jgi:predicted NACHT family NTPase